MIPNNQTLLELCAAKIVVEKMEEIIKKEKENARQNIDLYYEEDPYKELAKIQKELWCFKTNVLSKLTEKAKTILKERY